VYVCTQGASTASSSTAKQQQDHPICDIDEVAAAVRELAGFDCSTDTQALADLVCVVCSV